MASMVGADAQALEEAAAQLRGAAEELELYSTGLSGLLGSVEWIGQVASDFLGTWSSVHRVRLTSTADFVRDMAVTLDANAADQRQTSDGTGGGPGGSDDGGDGDGGDGGDDTDGQVPDELQRIKDILKGLGITLTAAQLDELMAILDDLPTDQIDDFLEAIDDSPVLDILGKAGNVLNVAGFIGDAITDFIEHPDLPMDERLIHAGVEAALKFGAAEGLDKALTAIGTAVGGPVGLILGKGAGFVAGLLFEQADNAFNITENAADVLTEFITDPVGTVEALGEAALDTLEDIGGAVDGFLDDISPLPDTPLPGSWW